jgi:uroporphyrinogen-III synthase
MNSNPESHKTLFISRRLAADSVFHQLKSKGWKIIDKSLLNIEYLTIDNIPDCDWIFFYSPNGVNAFADNAARLNYNIHSVKIAAYGPGTAEAIRSFKWRVDFIGSGEAVATIQKFKEIAVDSNVMFPIASNSKHALISEGNYAFKPINLVVYVNTVSPIDIQSCDVYIFTSSLNVKSFFINNSIRDSAQVIAIGQSTADTLSDYFQGKIEVSAAPTESELFNMILI